MYLLLPRRAHQIYTSYQSLSILLDLYLTMVTMITITMVTLITVTMVTMIAVTMVTTITVTVSTRWYMYVHVQQVDRSISSPRISLLWTTQCTEWLEICSSSQRWVCHSMTTPIHDHHTDTLPLPSSAPTSA